MAKKSPPFKRLYKNYLTDERGCWIWQGSVGSSGYGQIKAFGKWRLVHRLSYELYKGDIPKDMEIMHSCDNRLCINPDHLSVGDHAQNMKDARLRGGLKDMSGFRFRGVSGADRECSNQVLVLGKPYGSQKMAERELGLGSGTVRYWIKHKPEKAIVIDKELYLKLVERMQLESKTNEL